MKRRALAIAAFAAGLALAAAPLRAQPAAGAAPLEASVKAAYLYKFTGFVEWPPAALPPPGAPIVIGVAGADAVYAELTQVLNGRSLQGRPLAARLVDSTETLDGLHMLYVGPAASGRGLTAPVRGRPVLVVTDHPEGIPPDGALNFVRHDGRVRFEASLPAAERAGLRLSSRLLAVAERVVAAP